jgi:two-component system chemotaxis response regulator CheB
MTATSPYRVMLVDDSAVIRGLFSRFLEADPEIEVLTTASNGQIAIKALAKHDIEIVVLDIEMPVMDGLTALPLLLKAKPGLQVLIASTLTRKNAEVSLRAMAEGAADYVTKPSSTSEIHSAEAFKRELTQKIKALAEARRGGQVSRAPQAADQAPAASSKPQEFKLRRAPMQEPKIIAIGSSTGGPPALLNLLRNLGTEVDQPIVITQHMPPTFTSLLAEHITKASGKTCNEGKDGEALLPGRIYIAPGDYHMLVERDENGVVIRLNQQPPENYCRPAVDPMLHSLAEVYGSRVMVVILTGMGNDGQKGSETIVGAGGTVIAQDEASSVVWGMPGAVATAGLCSAVLPLSDIAPYVRKLVVRSAA